MAKKAKCRIIPRMKTFDQKHKGGKKAKLAVLDPKNMAGLGTPWPLSYPFTEKGKNAGGLL